MIPRLVAVAVVAVVAGAGACEAPENASVLVNLASFSSNNLPGLRAPSATLDVVDKDGKHLAVKVRDPDGVVEPVLVQSPLPVPCDGSGLCQASVTVPPGDVRFRLDVDAADRCSTRAHMLSLSSPQVSLSPYQGVAVDLTVDDAGFDDDGDGVANILESATCGRFDLDDGAFAPQRCRDGADDPCCANKTRLEGRTTTFAGGALRLKDGSDVVVAPFALDDTEVTWRQFIRCVAMGKCLAGEPDHPQRQQIGAFADELPMTGLSPADAAQVCAAYGKRLPLDVEWEFAAAHRDGLPAAFRARFPFDADVLGRVVDATPEPRDDGDGDDDDGDIDVGCQPDAAGGVSANHAIAGVSCPGEPLAVASYPSSWARRGKGEPVADLAGNVAEWTLVVGAAPDVDEMPPGFSAAVLRGGGALSAAPFLENDLPIVAKFPSSGDVAAWRASLTRLAADAGFRCAATVEDGAVAPPFTAEPACE